MNRILETVTLLAVSLLIPAGAAGQEGGSIRSKSLRSQPGSPLQEAGAYFDDTVLRVLLVNVSDREVTQALVGLVLEDGSSTVPAKTQSGLVCRANVPPGGFLVVTEAHNGFDRAVSYFREKGITNKKVTSGVTQVRFADGSEWTYPLESKGRFEEQNDEKLEQKVQALTEQRFPDKSMAGALFSPDQQKNVSTCRTSTEEPIPAKVRVPK